MKVIIDRFEGNFAVCECEDKAMINIERNKMPYGVSEGSVLVVDSDSIVFDEEETNLRRGRIEKMMDDLWE